MRIQQPRMRGRIAGLVLAATCASGLQLTGCARPSPRHLGAVLTKKSRAEAATPHESDSPTLRSTRHSPGPDFVSVDDASSKSSRSSLPSRRNQHPLASNSIDPLPNPHPDPFLGLDEIRFPQEKRAASGNETTGSSAFSSGISFREPSAGNGIQQIDQSVMEDLESLVRTDSARPFPGFEAADSPAPSQSAPSQSVHPIAESSEPTAPTETVVLKHQIVQVDEEFTSSAPNAQLQPASATDSQEVVALPEPSLGEPLAHDEHQPRVQFADAQQQTQPDSAQLAEIQPRRSAIKRVNDEEITPVTRETSARDRMEQLISMARTHQMRGETHAAYRNALLAKHIADKHELTIGVLDQCPVALCEEIAGQLWGSPSDHSLPHDGKHPSAVPSIKPKEQPSESHQKVFAGKTESPSWEGLPDKPASQFSEQNTASPMRKLEPAPGSSNVPPMAAVPETEIADAFSLEPVADPDLPTAAPTPSNFGLVDSDATAAEATDVESDQSNELQPTVASADAGQESYPDRAVPLFESLENAEAGDSSLAQSSTATSNAAEPVLAADSTKSAASVSPSGEKANAATASTNLRWGTMAFITATVLTMIGARLNRSKPAKEETLSEEASSESSKKVELKIRRAA
ncbi:hypothetical protein KOR42_19420 [Thalassoglobus neptunius]|uniref:Secreted protein n=1 Tax=Thalassoglobus neptunius TaxID=1938619 RepID=A0A5C5X6K4_9PLAN|nr:hypothetical protein [Thalassoglobus neptunius]TWT58560.1 hypothetical protein KOR42_19420 [Thalassoglobus neptunius]